MCVFSSPKPPPLPEPKPIAPRPEQTAKRVVVGEQRSGGQKRRVMIIKALIHEPVLNQEQMGTGNLNY